LLEELCGLRENSRPSNTSRQAHSTRHKAQYKGTQDNTKELKALEHKMTQPMTSTSISSIFRVQEFLSNRRVCLLAKDAYCPMSVFVDALFEFLKRPACQRLDLDTADLEDLLDGTQLTVRRDTLVYPRDTTASVPANNTYVMGMDVC